MNNLIEASVTKNITTIDNKSELKYKIENKKDNVMGNRRSK